jgi:hypothetical protein
VVSVNHSVRRKCAAKAKSRFIALCFLVVVLLSVGIVVSNAQNPTSPAPTPSPTPSVDDDSPQSWKEFTAAEGGFTVMIPGIPKTSSVSTETAQGPIILHNFVVQTKLALYFISYADFFVSAETPDTVRKMLDSGRDEVLSNGATLIFETDVTQNGLVGREVIFSRQGLIFWVRMYLDKNRLYQVIAGTQPNIAFRNGQPSANPADLTEPFNRNSRKFFESFKLIKN